MQVDANYLKMLVAEAEPARPSCLFVFLLVCSNLENNPE